MQSQDKSTTAAGQEQSPLIPGVAGLHFSNNDSESESTPVTPTAATSPSSVEAPASATAEASTSATNEADVATAAEAGAATAAGNATAINGETVGEATGEASDDSATGDNASGEAGADFPTEDDVRTALKEVLDPEIGISIIDLGLVYEINLDAVKQSVHVKMTLTSPGCPLGPEMTSAAYLAITRLPNVKDCDIELVWSPMWDPTKNPNEETRMLLGIW